MKHITFGHPVGIQRFDEILRVAFDSDGSGFVNGFFGYFLNCNINLGRFYFKKEGHIWVTPSIMYPAKVSFLNNHIGLISKYF